MKKAHLSELFVRGKLHTITDPVGGLEAQVYLKKLNLTESEEAVRKANAARAAVLAQSRDSDSELYKSTLADALEVEREEMLKFVISEDLNKARESAGAEIAANPEWADDNYLQSLHDAWLNEMSDRYAADPEDEDAKAVFEGLRRYADEIDLALVGQEEALIRDQEMLADDELRDLVVKKLLKSRSDLIWVEAYRNEELRIATRDADNHRKRYFTDVLEVKELENEVKIDLLTAYKELSVDIQEGKDSEEIPTS